MGAGHVTDLGEYLQRAGSGRRQEGVHDCCTFPCDWVVLCGWPDPMAKWRGTYGSEVEADALIAQAAEYGETVGMGGLLALFVDGFSEAGLPEVTGPFEAGDVGVVTLWGLEAGAIFTGKRWAFVPPRGLGCVSLDDECIVRAWRPKSARP